MDDPSLLVFSHCCVGSNLPNGPGFPALASSSASLDHLSCFPTYPPDPNLCRCTFFFAISLFSLLFFSASSVVLALNKLLPNFFRDLAEYFAGCLVGTHKV